MKKKSTLRVIFLLTFALLIVGSVAQLQAEIRLPHIFSPNMVLQREMRVPVWGWADPGEKVSVAICGQAVSATANAEGRWTVHLAPLKAGGPFEMLVQGSNTIKLENILVGEVWLCSGQSNMEWTLNHSEDSRADIPNINNPNIRLLQVEHVWNQNPQENFEATWTACNPETISGFSAIGYYFGNRLQTELNVPVGLINSSWGGTLIEPWTPPVGFDSLPSLLSLAQDVAARNPETEYCKQLTQQTLKEQGEWLETMKKNFAQGTMITPPPAFPGRLTPLTSHQQPTALYNAMVYPLVPFALRGAIWYQGESNLGDGALYTDKMRGLIEGWRSVFGNNDLAFYFVQLAPFDYKNNNPELLPKIWKAQADAEKTIPNTGMAVINDIGNLKDIHPDKKKTVGSRLAALALKRTYQKKEIVCDFPTLKEMKIEGNNVVLQIGNARELNTRDGAAPNWFEIAGADQIYYPADAKIDGTTIKLSSQSVANPFAARFAWSMLAEPNIQNESGLPMGAFQIDDVGVAGDVRR